MADGGHKLSILGVSIRVRDLSIRAKVAVTILGALAVGLGIATTFSLKYWVREQDALTREHALMVASTARSSVEAGLAHGQLREVRQALDAINGHPPVEGYRIVDRDGLVLMSSQRQEEGHRRPGEPLPNLWDIPSQGMPVGEPGTSELGVVIPVLGATGMGSRAVLELRVGGGRMEQALARARTFGLTLTLVLGGAYAILLGAMMEREIIGPFRKLERLAADQQVLLDQRAGFAEVGALASEVAHEIKRPLAGIRGAIELISQEYAMGDAERKLLGQVEAQLGQVDETLRDMLSLAKPVGIEKKPVAVSQVADAALARLAGLPGTEQVAVTRVYDDRAPRVMADAGRLEQAILNLCVNAVEAMSAGGRLLVEVKALPGAVEVAVTDTGSGIPKDVRDQILKPFFSTKARGTGLGLPLVARVAAAHGGRLVFQTEAGRGTTFRLELPAGEHDGR
jgi:signal transduction histidine kinase